MGREKADRDGYNQCIYDIMSKFVVVAFVAAPAVVEDS